MRTRLSQTVPHSEDNLEDEEDTLGDDEDNLGDEEDNLGDEELESSECGTVCDKLVLLIS
jgi:hypothetical protein